MSCCGPRPRTTPPRPVSNRAAVAAPPEPKGGLVAATKEKASERMAICQACPHARFRPFMHCAKCGCVLAWKTKLKAGTCPVGKW